MKRLASVHALVGESPLWSAEDQRLYWIDILGQKLFIYDPKSGENRAIEMPDMITTVAKSKPGELLIGLRKEVALFDLKSERLTTLFKVEENLPSHRFNDGKIDSQGRFWTGTINMDEPLEASCRLYRAFDQIDIAAEGIVFSNGLCWSMDNRRFYHVETFRKSIFVYDFDAENGALSNKRLFVKLQEGEGIPDGLNCDTEGGIWCAHFGAGLIVRYDPSSTATDRIEVPAPHVTNCTFGGPNLDTLYITTGCEKIAPEERKNFPEAGALFSIQVNYQGKEPFPFRRAHRSGALRSPLHG